MSTGFGLTGPAEGLVANWTVREELGFFAYTSAFFGEAIFKGAGLLHPTALRHGSAPWAVKDDQ
jgi:hypothetical protein